MELVESKLFYSKIIERAWDDPNFKENLLENPKVAITKLFGTEFNLPKGIILKVRDQSDGNIAYINIPRNINEMELSDQELEYVAGGDVGDNGWNPIKWIGTGLHAIVHAVSTIDWANDPPQTW